MYFLGTLVYFSSWRIMENQHYSHRIEIIYSCSIVVQTVLCLTMIYVRNIPPAIPRMITSHPSMRQERSTLPLPSCVHVPLVMCQGASASGAFNGSTAWSWCIGWYLNGLSDQMFRLVKHLENIEMKTWKHQTWEFPLFQFETQTGMMLNAESASN